MARCITVAARPVLIFHSSMPEKPRTPRRVALEASAWFKLLSNTSVRVEDLETFYEWRKDPANRAAFDRRSARSEFGRLLAKRQREEARVPSRS
jgi:ferric-dicitrate binding protein FerR (iron transport regulator)